MNTAISPNSSIMQSLDRAVGLLRNLGLPLEAVQDAPVVALIQKIAGLDEARALAVARVLQQAGAFNAAVRTEIAGMDISNRFETISQAFDSIRDDCRTLVQQLDDGKLSLGERLQNNWMNVARGSIPTRFEKIAATFQDVSRDLRGQLERESSILEAYKDFRVAMKEGQIGVLNMQKTAEVRLGEAKAALEAAMQAVSTDDGSDAERRARLELERDQKLRALQDADKIYQIAKDLADNLTVGYSATEVVMGRLQQTSDIKERVYQRGVAFFATNEVTFTALNASLNSMLGLNEGNRTLSAMQDGMNQSLELLAELGNQAQLAGIKAGYGATLKVESVQKLVEAVVGFQEQSFQLIQEMRQQASENSRQIADVVEEGQRRYARLLQQGASA